MSATSVTVRIQAHPSRSHLWPKLIESVSPLPVEVSEHSSEPANPWAGYQQALTQKLTFRSASVSHLLVLQDDVVVCRNFAAAVTRIAAAKPDDPVCLFLSWLPAPIAKEAREALIKGVCYIRARPAKFCPVVAVLWPLPAIERFLDWASRDRLPGHPNRVRSDDAVLGHWIRREQATVWITCPSLVEHPDREPSIWGRNPSWGRDKRRIALSFIGEQDPLEFDWS